MTLASIDLVSEDGECEMENMKRYMRAHITYIHAMLSFVLGFMLKRAHTSSIFDYFLDDTNTQKKRMKISRVYVKEYEGR